MTRVLVVASTFPASDSDAVPAFVKDQIKAMKQVDSSLEFSVLAPHDIRSSTKKFTKHEAYDEYRFHYAWPHRIEKLAGQGGIMPNLQANALNYLLIPGLFLFEGIALYRLTRKLRPDLLYAHWFTPQAVIARIVGGLTHTPFVFTTHASDVAVWHKIPVIGKAIVRWSTRGASRFTAVSERSMDKLANFFTTREWNQLKERSLLVPMGVDLILEPPNKPVHKNSIMFVGRIAEKKGLQYLLPAFKELLHDVPDATLTVAGDGPWLNRLKKQAGNLGLTEPQVTFPGYTTGAAKQNLINSQLVYVVPSIIADDGDAEGLPVTLMEGLAAGKLCIATNESGADNVLTDGKDGFLVPQKNSEALAAALKKALLLDNAKKEQMESNARRTAEQFSWPVIAKKHIEFLIKEVS